MRLEEQPAPLATVGASPDSPPPGLRKLLMCMVYEGVLLFGVVMLAGLAYGLVTQQRHALVGSVGLRVFLFFVLGQYFVYFWTRSGQTLAMLTWHIKLTTARGEPLGTGRAWARYVLAWLWFLPALATAHFSGLKSAGATSGVVLVGVMTYALLSRWMPQRQFLHDVACGTALVTARHAKSAAAPTKNTKPT